ncbi:HNH endonuclease [Salmonella enterica subsp. enterica serovar Newport]|nr:HNH endonuclease [Salmonella enterica subsp. enterica serovar Newport]
MPSSNCLSALVEGQRHSGRWKVTSKAASTTSATNGSWSIFLWTIRRQYFEQHKEHKMRTSIWGRKKLMALARRQNAVCPACGKALTKESGWTLHYRVRWCNGGQVKSNNLILLHPVCHDQYHSSVPGHGNVIYRGLSGVR